jgi:hypothetical protein
MNKVVEGASVFVDFTSKNTCFVTTVVCFDRLSDNGVMMSTRPLRLRCFFFSPLGSIRQTRVDV